MSADTGLEALGGVVLILGVVAIVIFIGFFAGRQWGLEENWHQYQDNQACNSRGMFLSQRQDDVIICQRPGRNGAKVILQRSELRR